MYKEKLGRILRRVQKPSRYTGGELNSVQKDPAGVSMRFAFCFPDTYDIGMSHLGMKILYSRINEVPEYWCERVFMPLPDMEEQMRANGILLYGLESLEPIRKFDFIGFTLQYELCYSNILAMLDLAGLPVYARDRKDLTPIVCAGGPCVCNAEPIADFVDLCILGEGEEVNLELMRLLERCKAENLTKREFLVRAAGIEGIYVPSLYEVAYHEDGTVRSITPLEGAPERVVKRIIRDFDQVYYPESFVVPFSEIVHDRAVVEVLRGCIRGCRFCQAGYLYRPFREKTMDTIVKETISLCETTGYDEVSLSSLSTSDYGRIEELLERLTDYTDGEGINLSLPSLRIDRFSDELLQKIKSVRKSGLTFAPEAGTQRLRDVINKNITEENVLEGCRIAFEGGYTAVKLYFMLGLPTETTADMDGIKELCDKIIGLYRSLPNRPKGKKLQISLSLSTFIPKPFTPFEFEPQPTEAEIDERQKYLLNVVNSKNVNISWSRYPVTLLEAALARGDRRLSDVIYSAWKKGCKLDGWSEYYRFDQWMEAFRECGIDPAFYVSRRRGYDEVMPWSHMDVLVSRDFLIRENKRAHEGKPTKNCREQCAGCGLNQKIGRECFEAAPQKAAPVNPTPAAPGDSRRPARGIPREASYHNVRIFFSKTGRAAYISHLDLYRLFQRAVRRCGLPVWETQGFNPHPYLTFALPLALGTEGLCESLDIRLTEELSPEEICGRLNGTLPDGIRALSAAEPIYKNTDIEKSEYEAEISGDMGQLDSFFSQEKILTEKKTKKGVSEIDLKPSIELLEKRAGFLRLRLPSGTETNISANLVFEAFEKYSGTELERLRLKRTAVYCKNGEIFR